MAAHKAKSGKGVTTEIMGEGESMGPVNDRVREHKIREQTDIKYDIPWNTLAEYLQYLEKRGVSCNVASFIGATTIREYVVGYEDKQPNAGAARLKCASCAERNGSRRTRDRHFTDLSAGVLRENRRADRAVQGRGKYQGKYISHMRSEGNQLFEALDELLRIAREANIPAELYHIKAAGKKNWPKEDELLSANRTRAKGRTERPR
jgi:N-acyl-D-amino-acid deacylase